MNHFCCLSNWCVLEEGKDEAMQIRKIIETEMFNNLRFPKYGE